MNEDYDYYVNCKYRKRNYGLFTADQVSFEKLSKTITKYVLSRFFSLVFEFEPCLKVISTFTAGIYLVKVNNGNIRTMYEIYTKLTKTPKRRSSAAFTFNFEQISHITLVFSVLTLN